MRKLSFKKKLLLTLFRNYRLTQAKLHDLTYLFWECTLRCNLSCRHCGSDCVAKSTVPDMPISDFTKVLDRIRNCVDPAKTIIVLTGGEPLLRKDLEACGREIISRGFPWGMVSNGYVLSSERLASLCASGLQSLTISLDGLKESHDWMRGKGSFMRAATAIRTAAAIKGLVFDVVTCVNKNNIGELEDIRELLMGLGAPAWRIFTVFPRGRAASEPAFNIAPAEFVRVLDFIKETRAQACIRVNFACEGFLGPYENEVRDGFFYCRAGINIGGILADGSISACPSMRGDFIQGNIYHDDFLDVWNNRFGMMRDRSWTNKGKCATCASYAWCEGNGLHLHEGIGGEPMRCHLKMIEEGS